MKQNDGRPRVRGSAILLGLTLTALALAPVRQPSGGATLVVSRTSASGALVVEALVVAAHRVDATMSMLRSRPDVRSVEREQVYETAAPSPEATRTVDEGDVDLLPRVDGSPGDPLRPQQWQYDRTTFEQAWTKLGNSGPVTVAVVDSGVDGTHPDLDTVVLRGCNKIRPALPGETPPPDPTGPLDAAGCYGRTATFGEGDARTDVVGHGTFVASLIAAPFNGTGIIGGGAPVVRVLPVKVLDQNNRARSGDIAAGIVWAVDNGARVVNLSISLCGSPTRASPCDSTRSQAIADAAAYARSHDVAVVASAGNRAGLGDVTIWPAAEPGVLAVTSSTIVDTKSSFANDGWFIGVAAPGENLVGALSLQTATAIQTGARYSSRSGTSFAAPLGAAAVAMVRSLVPSLTAAQAANVVLRTTRQLGIPCPALPAPESPTAPPPTGPCNAQFGYGLVDPAAALDLAAVAAIEPMTASASGVSAGTTRGSVTLTGRNLDQVTAIGLGAGMEVGRVTSRTSTSLTVEVNPLGALPGARTVSLSWVGGVARCVNCLGVAPGVVALAGGTPAAFRPRVPLRLVDTRLVGGRILADTARLVRVDPAVAAPGDVLALNVTVTQAAGRGHVTVYPAGTVRPFTSNVNVDAGGTSANATVVTLGPDGLALYASTGAHVVVDLTGIWHPTGSTRAGRLVPTGPRRLLDTRSTGTPLLPATTRVVSLVGAGLPADVSAVALTVTATGAAGTGFLTTWATGSRPTTSTLNLAPGDTVANAAIVDVARDDSGRPYVSVYASASTQLVVDVVGWFTGAAAEASGSGLLVTAPAARVLDTRLTGSALVAGGTLTFLDTRAGDATSLVANVTMVDTAGPGFGSVWAAGLPWPGTSTLNVSAPGQTRAALAVTGVGTAAGATMLSSVSGHVVVDVAGWFTR